MTFNTLFTTALLLAIAVTGFEAKARNAKQVALNDRPAIEFVLR